MCAIQEVYHISVSYANSLALLGTSTDTARERHARAHSSSGSFALRHRGGRRDCISYGDFVTSSETLIPDKSTRHPPCSLTLPAPPSASGIVQQSANCSHRVEQDEHHPDRERSQRNGQEEDVQDANGCSSINHSVASRRLRLMTSRSCTDAPPQTPKFLRLVTANSRHSADTRHSAQIFFAIRESWKKMSVSTPLHDANSSQSSGIHSSSRLISGSRFLEPYPKSRWQSLHQDWRPETDVVDLLNLSASLTFEQCVHLFSSTVGSCTSRSLRK